MIVANSTFLDISGGGIKLGFSGERGVLQPQNNESMPVSQQDRGFLISDNLMASIPVEYSGANPIFAGCESPPRSLSTFVCQAIQAMYYSRLTVPLLYPCAACEMRRCFSHGMR